MRALGAYIFAGGFTVGVKLAGFDVTCHLEGSNYGVPTAKENWPELPVYYPETAWPTGGPEVDALDFIYCNPPCAVFSPMGIVTTRGADSWRDDPRTSCWHRAFKLLEDLKPGAWACESVPQAYTRGRPMIDDMTRRALELGYSVTHLLLDAKWTGIPQSRKRFFLVCHRPARLAGYQFNWTPPPTIGEVLESVPEPGHRTVTTSRKDWYGLIADTPPGDRVVHTWERHHPEATRELNTQGKVKGRPSFQDRRLSADEVMGAWVGDKFYHPTEARHIGLNEAKAICGYPPEFLVSKSELRGFGSLLARAVMPTVGAWLGRAVATTLGGRNAEWSERRVFLVDVRAPDVPAQDITNRYLTKDGVTIPAELREAIGPGATNLTVIDEEECVGDEERPEETIGSDLDSGVVAETVGRADQGPARPSEIRADRAVEIRNPLYVTVTPPQPVTFDVWTAVAEMTGIDRNLVKRAGHSLAFTKDLPLIAKIMGVDQGEVERIALTYELITKQTHERAARPLAQRGEALAHDDLIRAGSGMTATAEVSRFDPERAEPPVHKSPAGTPVATAARVPEEPVIAGTGVSPAGTSWPVPVSLTAAGETSRERAETPLAADPPPPPKPSKAKVAVERSVVDPSTLSPSERPLDGEGSGAFIRRLLMRDDPSHTPERIVELVLAGFEGRKTTVKDVAWNWNKMLGEGLSPPSWRGAKPLRPNAYPGMKGPPPTKMTETERAERSAKDSAAINPGGAAGLAAPIPARSAARAGSPIKRAVIVDWFPRVCGATDYAGHLKAGFSGLEMASATRSGKPVKGWQTPWDWRCLKVSDAAAFLNGFDAVVMTDIACLSPHATEKNGLPWYVEALSKVTAPMTAVFHGGMQYKKDYDPAINALFTAPGFTGSIVTVRDGQARERLKPAWPDVRLVVNPFLPYDPARAAGCYIPAAGCHVPAAECHVPAARKTRAVMMSARLASNKGQNALLAISDMLQGDSHVWGENPYGLPSIGWRLHELGLALGYREDGPPKLRRDHLDLTHPNAPKFYTGELGFTTPSGRHYLYHDGYSKLSEVNWSPWLHLTMYTPNFGGLLEYTILDAVYAGAISVVPESTGVANLGYRSFPTLPFEGSTLWADEKTGDVRGKDFDRSRIASIINEMLRKPELELAELRAAQFAEVTAKHDPARAWASVEAAIRGEGSL